MRKDPVSQINLRLAPELTSKPRALSAISGRSLNALITLAIDEYVFLRRATVLEGQKIVDAYAKFDATLKPVRTAEEREALQAAQSQELKRAIEAERAAYEQAPTSMGSTQGQGVESVAPVHAEPVQTVEGQEDAACMPWARGRTEAQDATQEESQDVPEAPSAPKTEALDAAPLAGTSQAEAEEPAWILAARKKEAMRLELQKREKEEAEERAAKEEERKKQNAAAWTAKTAADTARICQKQDMAQAERMTAQAEEQDRKLQREGAISCLYVVQTSEGPSQGPAPESEDASQSMPGNQEASQTGNLAEASPVDALEALDLDAMTQEELKALARELKAQGLTYRQIAEKVGKSDRTVMRWLAGK